MVANTVKQVQESHKNAFFESEDQNNEEHEEEFEFEDHENDGTIPAEKIQEFDEKYQLAHGHLPFNHFEDL